MRNLTTALLAAFCLIATTMPCYAMPETPPAPKTNTQYSFGPEAPTIPDVNTQESSKTEAPTVPDTAKTTEPTSEKVNIHYSSESEARDADFVLQDRVVDDVKLQILDVTSGLSCNDTEFVPQAGHTYQVNAIFHLTQIPDLEHQVIGVEEDTPTPIYAPIPVSPKLRIHIPESFSVEANSDESCAVAVSIANETTASISTPDIVSDQTRLVEKPDYIENAEPIGPLDLQLLPDSLRLIRSGDGHFNTVLLDSESATAAKSETGLDLTPFLSDGGNNYCLTAYFEVATPPAENDQSKWIVIIAAAIMIVALTTCAGLMIYRNIKQARAASGNQDTDTH